MTMLIIKVLMLLKFDLFVEKLFLFREKCELLRLKNKIPNLNFYNQGYGGLRIVGNLKNFKIDSTSHLKSGTFIETTGGVYIGRYFHTGRGLTIFSTNHNYNSDKFIPYDDMDISKPVIVKDFVWCGANVTIVPGVTIGEGVVIGSGTVVTKDVPDYAIIGGNPHKIIKFRNIELFNKLKRENKFH